MVVYYVSLGNSKVKVKILKSDFSTNMYVSYHRRIPINNVVIHTVVFKPLPSLDLQVTIPLSIYYYGGIIPHNPSKTSKNNASKFCLIKYTRLSFIYIHHLLSCYTNHSRKNTLILGWYIYVFMLIVKFLSCVSGP